MSARALRRNCVCLLSLLFHVVAYAAAEAPEFGPGFTPLKARRNGFEVWHRRVRFGPLLLPSQITSESAELLAAPVHFATDSGLFEKLSGKPKLIQHKDESAQWTLAATNAHVVVTVKLTAALDGYCWYEMDLLPRHSMVLTNLTLEIPRVRDTARYLHTSSFDWSNVSGGLRERGGHWVDKFTPYVWLGDEARGLAWFAESSAAWKSANPARAMEVSTINDTVMLWCRLVDHPFNWTNRLHLEFGLQPSPVKPVGFAWRASARILHDIHYSSCEPGSDGRCELDRLRDGGVKTVVIHDSWTEYFGQTQPADAARLRALIAACHSRGLRLLVYIGYGVARTAPELKGHHEEWSVMPLIPWDPGYKPETRAFDATCARSGWSDWLANGIERLFSEYDLDGLYFDGTSEAWRCTNTRHGCGWRDAQGNVQPVYPINAARKLMLQLCSAVRRHKPDAILDAHMSSNLTLPTLSCCSSLWNGEQFETHTARENFNVPLADFRTEFMGFAHGLDMEFLCYENRPFTFDEALALALLHGVEVRPYPASLIHVTPLWKAMDRFGVSQAQWEPYWNNNGLSADNTDTQASYWRTRSSAFVVVSHLKRAPANVSLKVNPKRVQIPHGFSARDAFTGESLEVRNGCLPLNFDGFGFRVIELK